MWNNFGVDSDSIRMELRGYDWDDASEVEYVDDLVREHSAAVFMLLIHIGRTEDAERSYDKNDPLHVLCHSIVKNKVIASIIRSITHQDSELAERRDIIANDLIRFLERRPESAKKEFIPRKHRGVFGGRMNKGSINWDEEF